MGLVDLTPREFARLLEAEGGRGWVVTRPGRGPVASADWLAELSGFLLGDGRDFDRHEGVFLETGWSTGTLLGVFVHRTVRGQGAGGVRLWPYENLETFLRDGLRLAVGMSRKSALADLWWGGGKGVIARPPGDDWRDAGFRARLYREYGELITSLRGCYVAAEDVGTTPDDMAEIYRSTRFTTCIPPAVGGSGNPSEATARGVMSAMEAALEFAGLGGFEGRRVVIQGAGNVASNLVRLLLERQVGAIVVSDIAAERCEEMRSRHVGDPVEVRRVERGDRSIFDELCDVFSPNALGGILDAETIPRLGAAIVCGGANNQLLDDRRDDARLAARGVLYVPDFVANRMGIVHCSNEQYGWIPDDPAIERHFDRDWERSVYAVTRRILEYAQAENVTTTEAANTLADRAIRQPHPVWGHRGMQIIEGLTADRWELQRQPSSGSS